MYEVKKTEKFDKWLKKLKDNIAKIAILRRLDRIGQGNFGDSEFVGESVFELRFDIGDSFSSCGRQKKYPAGRYKRSD